MRQQILNQIEFIIPEKARGSKTESNNYVIVSATIKDNKIRKSNRFDMTYRRFAESEGLDPQSAAIAIHKSGILVYFDNVSYQNKSFHIIKPTYTIANRIMVEKLFKHFQENLDIREGAINRFHLRFTHKIGNAYFFEKL